MSNNTMTNIMSKDESKNNVSTIPHEVTSGIDNQQQHTYYSYDHQRWYSFRYFDKEKTNDRHNDIEKTNELKMVSQKHLPATHRTKLRTDKTDPFMDYTKRAFNATERNYNSTITRAIYRKNHPQPYKLKQREYYLKLKKRKAEETKKLFNVLVDKFKNKNIPDYIESGDSDLDDTLQQIKKEMELPSDSALPTVQDYVIETIHGTIQHLCNDDAVSQILQKAEVHRTKHELEMKSKCTSDERFSNAHDVAIGNRKKAKNYKDINSFNHILTTKNQEWISIQEKWFTDIIVKYYVRLCNALNKRPARDGWVKHCRNDWQRFCGAILSAGTKDTSLFKAMYILRKVDMLDLDYLANANDDDRRQIENLFLYVGYNYWSTGPAKIIAAARRVKEFYGGEIPTKPEDLLSFYGIARKVAVLILQDVHDQLIAIVVDTHLCDVFPRIGWCDELLLCNGNPDPVSIARAVESWLDPKLFRQVNEIFCGLRQLWNDGHRDAMTELAMEYDGIKLLSFMPTLAATKRKSKTISKSTRKNLRKNSISTPKKIHY